MIRTVFASGFLAAAMLSQIPDATAQTRVEVGTLICRMSPTVGAVIGSRRRMTCRFDPVSGRDPENYSGTITRFGLDVGVLAGGVMSWRVFTRTRAARRGALAGNYFGASGDASLGLGAGAKVLVGGSRRSTMLQPLALVGNLGVNIALGVTGLTLRYSK